MKSEKPDYVGVRELRKSLKVLLATGAPLVIGNRWHCRGVVVGVPEYSRYDDAAKKRALRQACKALRELLDQL